LEVVDPDFGGRVDVPAGLGKEWWNVAAGALSRLIEDLLSPLGSFCIETSLRRFGRRNRKLKKMKRAKLRVVIKSGLFLTFPEPAQAATGNCTASFSRGSENVPLPCISRLATGLMNGYARKPCREGGIGFIEAGPYCGGTYLPA
jgi:hypothetical protein